MKFQLAIILILPAFFGSFAKGADVGEINRTVKIKYYDELSVRALAAALDGFSEQNWKDVPKVSELPNSEGRIKLMKSMIFRVFGPFSGFDSSSRVASDVYHFIMPGSRNDYDVSFNSVVDRVPRLVQCHAIVNPHFVELHECVVSFEETASVAHIVFPGLGSQLAWTTKDSNGDYNSITFFTSKLIDNVRLDK